MHVQKYTPDVCEGMDIVQLYLNAFGFSRMCLGTALNTAKLKVTRYFFLFSATKQALMSFK